ncbi:hypothetical protein ASPVEDRAFT_485454 [Aspergillus versicolor CBS 583.65]|uniref:Enoyl reductase (ER) domain-containing protein n=1 Tax=Aspergillus versicolor CBS 583.65 TaxID=1036611 RepID=A0A1L9PBP8_ASPVE|nr:uncharacterized protein ASPVEDRAFT_485454 [Aspergillus versicolor CBS 583.65]OJI98875.1 hypothetical protein ASPVEDRAFT_485454 [Aspergillus versicolor CBS 583.65]
MQAIRLHPAEGVPPYSPSNPAPSSALHLDTIPVPKPSKVGELLIKVKASTIIRDTLTWPETYSHEYTIPGNDLAGTVVEVFGENSKFKPGDDVFGMLAADRPGAWAEYAIATESEVSLKPAKLTWEDAAALPLSGMTACEALFVHAGVPVPGKDVAVKNSKSSATSGSKKVLITGAGGAVGAYIVQLARLAGLHVTGATSSNERNAEFLRGLGADDTIEYAVLQTKEQKEAYDIIIDTVGGQPLVDAWACIKADGALVTVDSSSFNFLEEHTKRGIRREGIKALFFIIEGGPASLNALAEFADLGLLRVFVLDSYPLAKAREAYDRANGRLTGRGKIILSV